MSSDAKEIMTQSMESVDEGVHLFINWPWYVQIVLGVPLFYFLLAQVFKRSEQLTTFLEKTLWKQRRADRQARHDKHEKFISEMGPKITYSYDISKKMEGYMSFILENMDEILRFIRTSEMDMRFRSELRREIVDTLKELRDLMSESSEHLNEHKKDSARIIEVVDRCLSSGGLIDKDTNDRGQ
jgi:hypothetical protein